MRYMGSHTTKVRGKRMSFYRISGLICCLAVLVVAFSPEPAHAATLGDVLGNVKNSFKNIPKVLNTFGYIGGLYLVLAGIFGFKAHVDSPSNNHISAAIKKSLAGGGMLAAAYLTSALRGSIGGGLGNISASGRSGAGLSGTGIDVMVYNLVKNTYGPAISLLSAFVYISAIILLFVGISRLTKTAQEGPRGPAGLGTIITFLVSGALFSIGGMTKTFMESLFGAGNIKAASRITGIMAPGDAYRVQTVIDAVMAFVMIVGLIALIRGFFVLRAFADGGSQNASVAQALTFLFGGALAINLGEFINVLQTSLGIGTTLSFI